MVYTEIVTLKSRQGKPLESISDAFDDDVVAAKKTVVRSMNGRTIIYDFSTMTAQHWRPGNSGNRRKTEIILKA